MSADELNALVTPYLKKLPFTFQWPELLWLLVALPLLVLIYAWILRRKRKAAAHFASLAMFREAASASRTVKRHIPPTLFLLALVAMIGAAARPAAVVTLPTRHETIMLAIDISGSMKATDIEPSRLVAAQNAAKAFVNEQPTSTRIGIVAFAGTASVVQSPTNNRDDIIAAIDRFQTQRGTAIGSAIVISLAAIFPDAGITIEMLQDRDRRRGQALDPNKKPPAEFKPVPPGTNTNAAIVLVTDGQRTAGPDAIDAAKLAADRGIKIYTVGIGTPAGTVLSLEGMQMRVKLDEDAMKKIAATTHGEYFQAASALDLKKIYQSLNARFTLEKRETEISALFSAAAAALALLSGALSMLWFNRIL